MGRKTDQEKFNNMRHAGFFTKHAVETFEENMVNQKNYLDKVKKD
jgi:hypothetical protein